MPENKWILATVTLALGLVYDTHVHYKNKKLIKKLKEDKQRLAASACSSHLQVMHLCRILEENEVPASEFDLIVLNSIIPQ